jgi:hypothetical protein
MLGQYNRSRDNESIPAFRLSVSSNRSGNWRTIHALFGMSCTHRIVNSDDIGRIHAKVE